MSELASITPDRGAIARGIIDATQYMVLGTADATGRPWVSPVWFSTIDYREFFWVSSPDATHSRNIAVRPEIGIVIFDSTVAISTGQGVYVRAVAELVADADQDRGLDVFSERSVAVGGRRWTRDDVMPAEGIRLYRAIASEYSMLAKDGAPDHRVPVDVADD